HFPPVCLVVVAREVLCLSPHLLPPCGGGQRWGVRDTTHPSRPSPLAGEGARALVLSRTVASAQPAGASTPWAAARRRPAGAAPGRRLAGAAGRVGGQGRTRAACGSRPGAGGSPARGPWGLYPFGYRVYPSRVSGGRGNCTSGGKRCA